MPNKKKKLRIEKIQHSDFVLPEFNGECIQDPQEIGEVEEVEETEEVEEIEEVKKVEEIKEIKPKEEKFISYMVLVLARRLKYFSGPGIDYPYLGLVKQNEMFRVLEEKTGLGSSKWGRVEILGKFVWLPLDYCRNSQ